MWVTTLVDIQPALMAMARRLVVVVIGIGPCVQAARGYALRTADGRAAVHRIEDAGPRRVRRDLDRQRLRVEAALVTELQIGHDAGVGAGIEGAGRGKHQEPPFVLCGWVAAVGDVRRLRAKLDAVDQRLTVRSEQGKLSPIRIEPKTGVQPGAAGVAVGPDQEVSARLDRRQGRAVRRDSPFHGVRPIVRQVHAGDIDGRRARVV